MRLDRRNVPKEINPRISTSPLPAEIIELNEVRHDLLTVFGICIQVLSGLEQHEVFGGQVFFATRLSSGIAPPLSRGLFAGRPSRAHH